MKQTLAFIIAVTFIVSFYPSLSSKAQVVSPTRSFLTINDLTWEGQINTAGTNYGNTFLAIRYVPDAVHGTQLVNGVLSERRFLIVQFNTSRPNDATLGDLSYFGDLVEYAVRSPLKNGASDWTASNVPGWTEIRRWKNWSTLRRLIGTSFTMGSSGVFPASPYWVDGPDATSGYLWYTYQPIYGSGAFPLYGAVRLTDAEAGGTVSDANIFGPYYFRNTTDQTEYKDATSALIPIPASDQVAMGGKFLATGSYQAVVSDRGANTIGMWVVGDLPNLSTNPPAPYSVLWPTARHLYDTGIHLSPTLGSGYAMHRPPNYSSPIYMMPPSSPTYWEHNGVVSTLGAGDSAGTTVGDCFYSGYDHQSIDTVAVRMVTGASGGSWQPEIWNGSAWVAPTGWQISPGSADLSGAENVFWWPKVTISASVPSAVEPSSFVYRVRVCRTATGTSGGVVRQVVSTISTAGGQSNPYQPDPVSGYGQTYDDTHYGYSYMEFPWGGAWVQTGNVDGLAYFTTMRTEGAWYGAAPMWAQPSTGGQPIKYESPQLLEGQGYANGGKTSGPTPPYFFTFSPSEMAEVVAGTRYGDNRGLNPKAFTRVDQAFPALIPPERSINPNSPYYGQPTYHTYAWGNSVVFDPLTNELIVLFQNGIGFPGPNLLAFWQVRGDNTLPTSKTGDLNSDGKVDIFDYNILIGNFGKTGTSILGDLNSDGKVDIFDYNILVGNFGK